MMKTHIKYRSIKSGIVGIGIALLLPLSARAQTQAQTQTQAQAQAQAQTQSTKQVNKVCKTGYDANLPIIKTKISNMTDKLKRLKTSKQNSRARAEALRAEILTLDDGLQDQRENHQKAAAKASKSEKKYARYKQKWLDTGALENLNTRIKTRKAKYEDYKQIRAQYERENAEFETLGAKYQHIARDLLDRDRDCAGAQTALR